MARQAGRGFVQWLMTARRHLQRERFLDQIDLLVRVRALLDHLDRYEPVEVGVLKCQRQMAAATLPAWLTLDLPFAKEELAEPERQPLFSDPSGALKQQRLRQPAGGDGACQPVARPLVAVQRVQRHGGIYLRVG